MTDGHHDRERVESNEELENCKENLKQAQNKIKLLEVDKSNQILELEKAAELIYGMDEEVQGKNQLIEEFRESYEQ